MPALAIRHGRGRRFLLPFPLALPIAVSAPAALDLLVAIAIAISGAVDERIPGFRGAAPDRRRHCRRRLPASAALRRPLAADRLDRGLQRLVLVRVSGSRSRVSGSRRLPGAPLAVGMVVAVLSVVARTRAVRALAARTVPSRCGCVSVGFLRTLDVSGTDVVGCHRIGRESRQEGREGREDSDVEGLKERNNQKIPPQKVPPQKNRIVPEPHARVRRIDPSTPSLSMCLSRMYCRYAGEERGS